MSLKDQLIENMVSSVVSLPPMLKEEVVGKSLKVIKTQIREEVMSEFLRDAEIVVRDLTSQYVRSLENNSTVTRPVYTEGMSPEMYGTLLAIAQNFSYDYGERLAFNAMYRETYSFEDEGNPSDY
jgi:hypothetical protein